MKYAKSKRKGFTILELMIASTVFALMLTIVMSALVQYGKIFYQGSLAAKTQETSRRLIDEMTRQIRYTTGAVETKTNGGLTFVCMGNIRYIVDVDKPVDSATNQHALIKANNPVPDICDTSYSDPWPSDYQEQLQENTRVMQINATCQAATSICDISLLLVAGNDDDIDRTTNPLYPTCKPGPGSQFCTISDLSTTVVRRVI
jgi:prepilin-type N-terminal cleavage/methylation domain-containing protein